ncbi:MAG TPA: hypothetical protein VHB79_36045 [Polyangiaceae bacterium]|nr:hypothetical protein [Polyangiaceae bacterium]
MPPTARSFRLLQDFCWAVALALSSSGCYAYHITGNRVPPATEARSQTQVAYLWGVVQPNDIVPPNCPKNVPLADVTARTNLGYALITTVTLGIVSIHELEWRCAKDSGEVKVLRAAAKGSEG